MGVGAALAPPALLRPGPREPQGRGAAAAPGWGGARAGTPAPPPAGSLEGAGRASRRARSRPGILARAASISCGRADAGPGARRRADSALRSAGRQHAAPALRAGRARPAPRRRC
ncbi:placenta-specific protein 9 isoform X3 [Felis catus]|uniref:placenta-specific protein 9 isoform X3 n=1 Tax=Felis catus TaxID=9685 RepID=UPI001D19FE21|nr:placenta-specific protein 9 isoform X3 [Felis catus]